MKNRLISQIDESKLPNHIVIIMDGNGRWAKDKGLDRISGHQEGMKSVKSVVRASREIGIKSLTLYAFSAQNWKRPKIEVTALMELLKQYLLKEGNRLKEKGIKLNAIGRLNELPEDVYDVLIYTMGKTRACSKMLLTLALSYGGREEIIDAVKKIASQKNIILDDINPETFTNYLYTSKLPDPDLFIRTSGEFRLSNFMLWQLAYTEIYITKTLWPNFRRSHLLKAIINFQQRERRYGLTGEQIRKRKVV